MSEPVPNEGRQPFLSTTLIAGWLAIVILIAAVIAFAPGGKRQSPHVACMANLRQLAVCLDVYARDHGRTYPPVERWCDVVVRTLDEDHKDIQKIFRCPLAKKGPCDYSMNPHASPRGACGRIGREVVLLFESKPGWNQSGGPELLTTDNHRGEGCSVLFADLHVEFVKTVDLSKLKWKYEDPTDANVPRDLQDAH
ncbi:MAG: hypothetical protein ABFE13_01100 [Phycisphaerales bacterium]